MGIIQRSRRTDTDWLAKEPIGPYVDAFKQYLAERGYAAHTFASYVVGITHFARWARTKRLERRGSGLPSCKATHAGFIFGCGQTAMGSKVGGKRKLVVQVTGSQLKTKFPNGVFTMDLAIGCTSFVVAE